jgi:hypothetical protein
MDNLTPESAAVRLYAAATMVAPESIITMLEMTDHPTVQMAKLMIENIAAEHERLCLARIATAEREARVRGLEEAMELCHLGRDGADVAIHIRALITAAEQTQENANG